MSANPDFEALYSDEPAKVRANANLPGDLVWPLTKLTNHATFIDKTFATCEKAYPNYGHKPACQPGCTIHWTWQDFGIPERWNPTKELIHPYLQLSRAESMKGSEQVVRSFQSTRPNGIEGTGLAPDLTPRDKRAAPGSVTLVAMTQNGYSDAKKEASLAKRLVGLGGK